jgi:hypothetical protein
MVLRRLKKRNPCRRDRGGSGFLVGILSVPTSLPRGCGEHAMGGDLAWSAGNCQRSLVAVRLLLLAVLTVAGQRRTFTGFALAVY